MMVLRETYVTLRVLIKKLAENKIKYKLKQRKSWI